MVSHSKAQLHCQGNLYTGAINFWYRRRLLRFTHAEQQDKIVYQQWYVSVHTQKYAYFCILSSKSLHTYHVSMHKNAFLCILYKFGILRRIIMHIFEVVKIRMCLSTYTYALICICMLAALRIWCSA